MGVGFWAVTQKSDYKEFSSISTDPAAVMIAVGLLIFIISFFGTVGALRENICFLRTVSILFCTGSRICIVYMYIENSLTREAVKTMIGTPLVPRMTNLLFLIHVYHEQTMIKKFSLRA